MRVNQRRRRAPCKPLACKRQREAMYVPHRTIRPATTLENPPAMLGERGGVLSPPHGSPAGTLQHHASNYAYTRTYTSTPNPLPATSVHNPIVSHAGPT